MAAQAVAVEKAAMVSVKVQAAELAATEPVKGTC
jgi:hypothetical protein